MSRHTSLSTWGTPPGLRYHAWKGEVVAYHPGSSDTHLLSPIAGAVLEAVASGAQGEAAILSETAHQFDRGDRNDLAAAVAEAIATLARLGLLEPATP